MYHFSGFNFKESTSEANNIGAVESLANQLAFKARKDLGLSEKIPLYLDQLSLIGGEKRQIDSSGELLLSGTERDVTLLREHIISQCASVFNTKLVKYNAHNYLTTGSQDLTVTISIDGPRWIVNDEPISPTSERTEAIAAEEEKEETDELSISKPKI
jgi:hypothetical protein